MSTFDEAAHPRTSAGVTTGGQFTTKPKGEPAVALASTTPTRVGVPVHAIATVDVTTMDPLPEWPASLGEPQLYYERDPESDTITLTVVTDDAGSVKFYADGDDSFDVGVDEGEPISSAERDALRAWGRAALRNVDVAHFAVDEHVTKIVQDDVLAIATGRDPSAARLADDDAGNRSANKARRVADLLSSWVDDVDTDPQTALSDALADLAHFARSRGVDLRDVLPGAIRTADDEYDEDLARRAGRED